MIRRLHPPRNLLLLIALASAACVPHPGGPPAPVRPVLVDDVASAYQLLEQAQAAARLPGPGDAAARVTRLASLGMFDAADSVLALAPSRTADLVAAGADLRLRQYRFTEAREWVDALLREQPNHHAGRLLSIRLAIQAWHLDTAEAEATALLARGRRDPEAAVLIGRIRLLRKDPELALEWAERALTWRPDHVPAHLLAADAHLWAERLPEAEISFRTALAIDPFSADARFGYGYLLWRKGSPGLIPAMASQWEMALAIDPLHRLTHWHLGNGHTPLTYADHAAVADTAVRAALAPIDSLIASGQFEAAMALARTVGAEYPGSPLPAVWRGSTAFIFRDRPDFAGLDSAQAAFQDALRITPLFGPAHNGLAAVLKGREFHALAAYDSLEAVLATRPLPMLGQLNELVPDLTYYPSDRVARMVVGELGPMLAFVPLSVRLGQRLLVPPLHRDLAAATGDPSFRTAVTFDNRQWMDIRGVGGSDLAAAGLEYLERGAHQERAVLLHEYTHLVHASILTDAQVRTVNRLYLQAMSEDRTLDYYAASNEQEFLAQAVEAYLSPVKVHPLNHKSMNSWDDLERKDPETYAFVGALLDEAARMLAGDATAMRANRAQVYVTLSERVRGDAGLSDARRLEDATALLDSALVQDPIYLPAMLSYAALQRDRGRWSSAEAWLERAESIDPEYTPILVARADLLGANPGDLPGAAETRVALLRRAAAAESDVRIRARHYRNLWQFLIDMGRVPEAIATAEEYVAVAPTVSTWMREAREEARLVAIELRAGIGEPDEALSYLRERVASAPWDYSLRGRYADVLVLAGQEDAALQLLEETAVLLDLAGDHHADISLRLAELRLAGGDTVGASAAVDPLLRELDRGTVPPEGRIVRLLVSLGQTSEANRQLGRLPEGPEPGKRSEHAFTRGWIAEWRGDLEEAERLYREAVQWNPYNRRAIERLERLMVQPA